MKDEAAEGSSDSPRQIDDEQKAAPDAMVREDETAKS